MKPGAASSRRRLVHVPGRHLLDLGVQQALTGDPRKLARNGEQNAAVAETDLCGPLCAYYANRLHCDAAGVARSDAQGHAQEDLAAAQRKAGEVIAWLHSMRLEMAVPETLAYYAFPEEHWRRMRTNNPLERVMRKIGRHTRVVGAFPDGNSAIDVAAPNYDTPAGTC